jgi:cullin 1
VISFLLEKSQKVCTNKVFIKVYEVVLH